MAETEAYTADGDAVDSGCGCGCGFWLFFSFVGLDRNGLLLLVFFWLLRLHERENRASTHRTTLRIPELESVQRPPMRVFAC